MPDKNKLTYPDFIEKVMIENGGYAPLKLIYQKFHERMGAKGVRGKTPLNSLRHEALSNRRFVRIGLGVYALSDREPALTMPPPPKTKTEKVVRRHSEIQGMLLEIGNTRDLVSNTYTNDRKARFQNKTLGNIATMRKMPAFTYKRIMNTVRFVDVAWFNDRGFPMRVFEVEHTSDFRGALTKFCDLQDFRADFRCVAEQSREDKFFRVLEQAAFSPIRERCKFIAYEKVETAYQIALEGAKIEI